MTHVSESCRGVGVFKSSASDTLKIAFFRQTTPNFGYLGAFLGGGGLGDPRPGRGAIDRNRIGGLHSTFLAMRGMNVRKFRKIGKKISVFRRHAAIKFRFWPILLHIWKALGRPRRMVPPCQQQISKGEEIWGVKGRFFRLFSDRAPTKAIFSRCSTP